MIANGETHIEGVQEAILRAAQRAMYDDRRVSTDSTRFAKIKTLMT